MTYEIKTKTFTFQWSLIVHLIVGALVYYAFHGNPTWATAIPFVGIVFFWPFYLIYKALFWILMIAIAGFLIFGAFLIREQMQTRRKRAAWAARVAESRARRDARE